MSGELHGGVRRAQRGISLLGLLFWAVIIGFLAIVGLRVTPTVMEYYTIISTCERISKGTATTVAEVRNAFDRTKDVEYSIVSISGKDLDITKKDERIKISFAYDKEVSLFGPVSLLIKYKGETR